MQFIRKAFLTLLIITGLLIALCWRAWQIRTPIEDTLWPLASNAQNLEATDVQVTWLGISTLLFDDGTTQILIDAAITHLSPLDVLLNRDVSSDTADINHTLADYGLSRLAAIVPTRTHFDHAIDAGHIANRTNAVVLGSESMANIVRGAELPVHQYQILADGESRQFGDFTLHLIASSQPPLFDNTFGWWQGRIESPLAQPAAVSQYRSGTAWSIFLEHPKGNALIQGSSGFIPGKLDHLTADITFLSIAGLGTQSDEYLHDYWDATVTASQSRRVLAIHFDDFLSPFGETRSLPVVLDNLGDTAERLNAYIRQTNSPPIERPVFGQPIKLY